MTDHLEHPSDYSPEVRPAPRYNVGPGGLESLARDSSETPYRSMSRLAVAALAVAVAYFFFVALGGVVAFWDSAPGMLIFGTLLVPLLSLPVAAKFGIRDRLGLLRIAGLALAVFYAVAVGIGGLVAFPSHSPWLMPLWTFAFPLLAASCGAAALLRIQTSEDTLSGKPLATWAVGLSLFFGLCYAAIYTATYLAVSQQAEQFATQWIDKLQKDDVEGAFVLTIPPSPRSGSDTLTRNDIELTYNYQAGPDGLPPYSNFGQKSYVRLLRGSSKKHVELVAVRDWGYQGGGYLVRLSYRVTTPYWSFPLELTVHGSESPGSKSKGRRWFVRSAESGIPNDAPQPTADGQRLMELMIYGRGFVVDETRRTPSFPGGPVKIDEQLFWAPAKIGNPVVEEIKKKVAAKGKWEDWFHLRSLQQSPWPLWSEEDGRLRFCYDGETRLQIPIVIETPEGKQPGEDTVSADLRLIVSCSAAALQGGAPEWRVEGLELIRARTLDLRPPQGGQVKRPR